MRQSFISYSLHFFFEPAHVSTCKLMSVQLTLYICVSMYVMYVCFGCTYDVFMHEVRRCLSAYFNMNDNMYMHFAHRYTHTHICTHDNAYICAYTHTHTHVVALRLCAQHLANAKPACGLHRHRQHRLVIPPYKEPLTQNFGAVLRQRLLAYFRCVSVCIHEFMCFHSHSCENVRM
jgi:hypothetical protein